MAHTYPKRIIKAEIKNNCVVVTVEVDDGGELIEATGVVLGSRTPIITFVDDRYGRIKFMVDKSA